MNTDDAAKRAEYIEGLRQIADFLTEHPEVSLPWLGSVVTGQLEPTMSVYLVSGDAKTELATTTRALGNAEKTTTNSGQFVVYRRFAGLVFAVYAPQGDVCERVVVGTREVEVEEPDPAALAAVPKVKRIKVVEDVEWRCGSVLAGAAAAVGGEQE